MKLKNEFKAGIFVLIAGLLLFSMLQSDMKKNNKNPTTLSGGFQSFGSGISEQNLDVVGSQISELEKWRLMVGLGKEDEN